MNTPICDFVARYTESEALRLHMPGHKGKSFLGFESADITEIEGADSLYEASGIIKESEANASALFGCTTLYSTEGSSLCIRAMLYLATLHAKEHSLSTTVLAGRNAHKTFLSAVALLDLEVDWIYPEAQSSYLSCNISPEKLDELLEGYAQKPMAVYITSPDYLGNISDIKGISRVCRKHGTLLLTDNAHGAYLKFLPKSLHPIDLGADMCCDSAHKTLPVLTSGAYLHLNNDSASLPFEQAKNALALFGSTSPSYLTLQSLDYANKYIADGYKDSLKSFLQLLTKHKELLINHGYTLTGNEPMKITISAKDYGYTGSELAQILQKSAIHCEFSDPDYIVFMPTPESGEQDLTRLSDALTAIPKRDVLHGCVKLGRPKKAMSVREAILSPCETLPVRQCNGRVLAAPGVSCPPAVCVVVSGEVIDEDTINTLLYYSNEYCTVVK